MLTAARGDRASSGCSPGESLFVPVTRRATIFHGGRGVKNQFWTAPNQLTLLRLIFIPFVITNVLDDNWQWALALLVLAGLSDALDGWLARILDQRREKKQRAAADMHGRSIFEQQLLPGKQAERSEQEGPRNARRTG